MGLLHGSFNFRQHEMGIWRVLQRYFHIRVSPARNNAGLASKQNIEEEHDARCSHMATNTHYNSNECNATGVKSPPSE
eukprot:scaffold175961_cov20-Prasinocladus_malaysianus.AAC.1